MGQNGFTKWAVALLLCVIIAGGSYIGYRSAHANAPAVKAHKLAIARQIVKVDKGKQLQTKLEAAWKQTLSATPPDGNVDVAVYDHATGMTAHYATTTSTFNTASIMKLSILETLLWHDQEHGLSGLTSSQLASARPMIENSDNNAASTLYLQAGGSSGLNAFFRAVGATNTTAGGHWGLTQTTALDQLKVVNLVAYPGKLLTANSVGQASDLMNHVESDQRWGITAGVPAGVSVQLKNGWLDGDESGDGWDINSIGHVHGNGVDYTIAVLTNENKTMQNGINTIQALSADTWKAVDVAASQ